MEALTTLQGLVVQGHGVASGAATHSPYPQGSVSMQLPFFKALGLDLSTYWPGTLNISIAPHTWSLVHADYCFEHVEWTHLHPPETFSFVRLQLLWQQHTVPAWLYYPHPETKAAHHQTNTMVEVIAPRLDGLAYGDSVQLGFTPGCIQIV